MSEEAKVEGAETPKVEGAADEGFGAEWASLKAKEEGQEETPPASEPKEGKGGDKPQAETPAEAPPASDEKADDPWKDAPPELREAHERELEAERTRAAAAETLVKRHSGRLSQAHHELSDLRAKLAPQKDSTAASKEAATDREERIKQLREEYPDVAGPLLDMLAEQEATVRSLQSAQASQAEAQSEGTLQEQLGVLEQSHPTWTEDVKDPAFVEWALKQPGYVQEGIRRNAGQIVDGATAADILDRFKASRGGESPEKKRIADRRAEQKEAGQDTLTKAPAVAAAGSTEYEGAWKEFADKDKRQAAARR